MDLRITGGDQLRALARDLKAVDNRLLRKEMLRGLRAAAGPVAKRDAPKAARDNLPKGGGLNEYVADSRFAVRTRTAGRDAGVRIVGTKGNHDLAAMDAGDLRHRVFDSDDVWVDQKITPGWWTKGLPERTVAVPMRRELLKVLDRIAKRLRRG